MQKNTIVDLIRSFNEQSEKVRNCLTDLLDIIKDGRVPSSEAMSDLDCFVGVLNTKYDAIYAMAQDAISAEELPEKGVAVEVIADAVKNSRAKYIGEQLEHAKAILTQFAGIKSFAYRRTYPTIQ